MVKTYCFYDYKDFSDKRRGTIEVHDNHVEIVNHLKEHKTIPIRNIVSVNVGDNLYGERSNWYTYVQFDLINGNKINFIFKYQNSDAQELKTDIKTMFLSV